MSPIEYIPIMRAYYASLGRGEYPLFTPEGCPWAPLRKPLRESRLALVCSAGLSRVDQPPFYRHARDDLSIREIPSDTPPEQLVFNYSYFDHRDAEEDVNCVFPLARLRDLEAGGFVGSLAPVAYALGIGRWTLSDTPSRLQNEVAADLVDRFQAHAVDAVLLVPT